MTEQLIADYNAFLVHRGMVRNSISFYMCIMRAVYNKAVRQKLVEQSHPFTEVYTGIDPIKLSNYHNSLNINLFATII